MSSKVRNRRQLRKVTGTEIRQAAVRKVKKTDPVKPSGAAELSENQAPLKQSSKKKSKKTVKNTQKG